MNFFRICLLGLVFSSLSAAERPNLILIVADDLGWTDLGVTGSQYYETPRIDQLARGGVLFTNHYTNGANCAPTRASMLSGLYTPRHGIYTVGQPFRVSNPDQLKMIPAENRTELDPKFVTIAERLREAGYDTASIGKWHLGSGEKTGPEGQGFDLNIAGDQRGHPSSYFSPYRLPKLEEGPQGEYLTDRLTDEALRWIAQPRDKPFFLYFPHYAVHTPLQAPDDLLTKYKAKKPEGQQKNPTYAGMVESLDRSVGRIVDKLTELGLAENTCILFVSDNGGFLAATSNLPLRGAKGEYYEGGIRVPLIAYWPGRIPAGRRDDTPGITLDLYPTLLEMAGLEIPAEELDGLSLLPLMTGEGKLPERPLFWHLPCYLRTSPVGVIRRGEWKLLEFFEDGRLELYRLSEDIGEKNNLAEALPERTAALLKEMREWRERVKADMPKAR